MGEKFDPRCHIGETHGIYTIVDMLDEKDKYGHWKYKCVCNECGYEKFSTYGEVSSPSQITTQCKHTRADGSLIVKYQWKNKRVHHIFNKMMERCYSTKCRDYRWYGAKGIGICKEWRDNPELFEEWALRNGYTDMMTIDRIESDKNYCPENCQWILHEENTRKAGDVNWIDVDGEILTGRQWSEKLGLGVNAINTSIKKYGIEKTKELVVAMLKEPPSTKNRKLNQSWFSVYGI